MKPILLYSENETIFTSNGLGSLNEAISAIVTEERNGTYELVLTYPVSGKHFADIGYSCIIKCATVPGGEYQLFRIYAISKERNGVVTINAEHISYQLSYIPVDGFTASSVTEALYKMGTEAMTTCPFTFWTDKETVARYHQDVPENIRARLGGTQGSILDVYGGEYEWDNYTVKLHNHRGANRNVTLRYGKNITDITQEENISSVYTSIVGYYKDEETDTVTETAVIDSEYASAYPFKRVKIVDFSSDYETPPTVQQLTQKATSYMNNNDFGIPHINIEVSFIALWQTDEYKDVAPLERVYLCDTVSVNFEKLGITTSAKVVKTKYNVLLDRYDSIDLGEARTNLSSRLAEQENIVQQQIVDARSTLEKAIDHATELITGGLGGHVVLSRNADGEPEEILIMNTDDISTATKVWRWNVNGLGYSNTGYSGQYGLAMTMDGAIVANYITSGTMQANRVRAGLLTDEVGNNYWNLTTGEFKLSTGVLVGTQTFAQYAQSVQDQIDGNITTWFYAYAPTTSNAPASTWTTVNDKIAHIGDLFYNSDTGYCYRWQVKSTAADPAHPTANDFEWVQISDEDIAAAMAAANNAQDTADHKRRVFTSTPTPPYDVGDLWCVGSTGDILTCTTARASGSFVSTDFTKQNKYTDDSYVQTWISNTYSSDKTNLQNQIDGKAETWYQSADPSTSWTTTALKDQHLGDLWYKTANNENTTWFYTKEGSTYKWVQENVPKAVFDEIDGKAQIFISTPTPPYYQGDLWFNSTSSDIMTCITDRTSGNYTASDWQKRNKYVDESTASAAGAAAAGTAITAYDNTLNQQKIFNKLTNNGAAQGIYLQNNQLYVNAAYIATGILADTSGNTSWNLSTGALSSKKFSVQSTNFTLTEAGIITATGATLNGATINSTNSDNYTLNISSGIISFNNNDAFLKYKRVRSTGSSYNVGAILYGADQLSIASGGYSESGTTTQLTGSAINLFTVNNKSRIDLRCDELWMYSNTSPYENLEVTIDARKFKINIYPQYGNDFSAEPIYLTSNNSNAPLLDFDASLDFNNYVEIPYNFSGDSYGNIYYDTDRVYIASGINIYNVTRRDGVYW